MTLTNCHFRIHIYDLKQRHALKNQKLINNGLFSEKKKKKNAIPPLLLYYRLIFYL